MKAQFVPVFAALFIFLVSAQAEGLGFQNPAKGLSPTQGRMIPLGSEHSTLADGAGMESAPFHLRITSKPSHPHMALDAPRIDGYGIRGAEALRTLIFISPSGKPTGESGRFQFNKTGPASEGGASGILSTAFHGRYRQKDWTLKLPYIEIAESYGSKSVKMGIFDWPVGQNYTPARLVMDKDGRLVHPENKVQWLACITALSTEANPIELVHVSTGNGKPKSDYCRSYTPIEMTREVISDKS